MTNHPKLLESVIACLCNDLIGPTSATHNGIKLAEDGKIPVEAAEMMAMAKATSAPALGRLAFSALPSIPATARKGGSARKFENY